MFKKAELLSKSSHVDLAVDEVKDYKFAKDVKFVSVGLGEISRLASRLPVIISGGDKQEFVVLMSTLGNDNYYATKSDEDPTYIPAMLRAYPFLMVDAKEDGKDSTFRAVAIDSESDYVGKKKESKIFEKEGELSAFGDKRVKFIQNFDQDRLRASEMLDALKEKDLLDKRSFDVKLSEKDTKTIVSDFHVVNKERLLNLDDATLVEWMKKGWISAIEAHISSIVQIQTLIAKSLKKKEK
jgi:hypothetical protein